MLLHTLLASEEPNGPFLPGDVKEFWWALLAFLVIFFFFWTKAVPLIKDALSKGQASAVANATAADRAIADAKAKVASASAELGDANAQSERIISEARTAAGQLRIDSANRTQQLVNDMWAKAQTDVASMNVQASADTQAEVAAQAVGAAEQIVASSLDTAGQNDLIESYISGLRTA